MAAKRYCIGGVMAVMTEAQARRWNLGETTSHDLRTVRVMLPDAYVQPSEVRHGQVVMCSPRLTGFSHSITLARATNERLSPWTAEAMFGMPAEEC